MAVRSLGHGQAAKRVLMGAQDKVKPADALVNVYGPAFSQTQLHEGEAGSSETTASGSFRPRRGPSIIEEKIQALVAPEDEGSQRKLDLLMCGVILVNAVVIVVEVDWGPEDPHAVLSDRLGWFLAESFFLLVYLFEMAARMFFLGWDWRRSWWNWLDLVVVVTSAVDCWFLTPLLEGDIKTLRLVTFLRMIRLVRLVRLVRVMRMFRGLYVMVMAFACAMQSLVWIVILMLLGLIISATAATVAIGHNSELKDLPMRGQSAQDLFGSVPRSIYTLFELMTLEDWHEIGRPLVMEAPALFFFIVGFIIIFTFGILNMIVAMVIERTLAFAKQQDCSEKELAKQQMARDLEHLRRIFLEADDSGVGELRLETFRAAVERDDTIKNILRGLDIPTSDAVELFLTLDAEQDGRLRVQSFLDGIAKLRGALPQAWDEMATHAGVRFLVKQAILANGGPVPSGIGMAPSTCSLSYHRPSTVQQEETREDSSLQCLPSVVGCEPALSEVRSVSDGDPLARVLRVIEAHEELHSRRHAQVLQRLQTLESTVQHLHETNRARTQHSPP